MAKRPEGPLIPGRVLLIGEQSIPREELEKLSDEEIQVFLREPDTNKWPSEMAHLRKYLAKEEQIKWGICGLLREHEKLLGDALRHWSLSIWRDLYQRHHFPPEDRVRVMEEMANYLKALIERYLTEEEGC